MKKMGNLKVLRMQLKYFFESENDPENYEAFDYSFDNLSIEINKVLPKGYYIEDCESIELYTCDTVENVKQQLKKYKDEPGEIKANMK